MRNADFFALSGFVQGIHGILFYIAEMEIIDQLTERNSTIFEFCASKYTIAREERICNGRRKPHFPVLSRLSYTSE